MTTMMCGVCSAELVADTAGFLACPLHGTSPTWATQTTEATEAPADPFTAIASAAIQLHHLFVSFCEGGFSEWQALRLVAAIMVESGRGES